MPTTVQAIGLTKKYNLVNEIVHAVDDVSLSVQAGELVAITGRPGSGKSSLLHILGCLQRPDPGRLWIDGLEVTPLEDDELALVRARRIGFVCQAFNLLPNENAVRNVELPLKSQSVPAYECREKAEQALRTVGLGHCVEYPLHQLSAAQRQLVSIARALVNDPSVIFLDEPTRGLDSTSREELMGLLQKLNDQGRTIVMTTKDPVEARYCLRMVKLGEGKILENILVSNQRIVPSSKVPGTVPKSHEREVAFCPRCNYSNFKDQEVCKRCECPLELTDDEVESIEGRLSGSNNAHLGVEDDIEEEEEPQGQIDDVTNELKEIPFFAGLGPKSLTRIIPSLEEVSFSRRSTIIKQGEVGDSFYVIRSGNVRVVREVDDAAPTHLAELGPNEGFGEMALLTDEPRSATVVAKTDVEVWRLSREAFEGLLAENLSLAVYFNRILSQRLRTLQEKIVPYS